MKTIDQPIHFQLDMIPNTICGKYRHQVVVTSTDWEHVTCEECLKRRKGYLKGKISKLKAEVESSEKARVELSEMRRLLKKMCPKKGRRLKIEIVEAGVGEGHPKDHCSFCHKFIPEDEERIATCTQTEYVTLCRKCYNEAGNSVR